MKKLALGLAVLLQSAFAMADKSLSFSCESLVSKTTLEVVLEGPVQLETGNVEMTQKVGRPAKAVVEKLKISRTNMEPYYGYATGVEFIETFRNSNHNDWYQSSVRSFFFPKRLFSSRPYRKFDVTLGDLDPESGLAKLDYFKCELSTDTNR